MHATLSIMAIQIAIMPQRSRLNTNEVHRNKIAFLTKGVRS